MANEKRLIDANRLITTIQGTESEVARNAPYDAEWFTRMADRQFEILRMIDNAPTVDAVEVDTVIEMFEYMLGDCPCNFSPVDEWLTEQCELLEECPNPEDKRGCWKQFIKHFCAKMDGDGNG